MYYHTTAPVAVVLGGVFGVIASLCVVVSAIIAVVSEQNNDKRVYSFSTCVDLLLEGKKTSESML